MTRTRVNLRPMTDADLPAMETWYGEALAAVYGLEEPKDVMNLRLLFEDSRRSNCELLVIERADGSAPVGLIRYDVGVPAEGWVAIGLLTLASGQRGWGYGSEAVRFVEAETAASRYAASVHRRNGLGLYFWLRLGYRPAHAREAFWRGPDEHDTIAMLREVASSSSR